MKRKFLTHFTPSGRKGQIQMTETIAVLFIFFVLIIFGMVFYFRYTSSEISEKQDELLAQRAIDTVTHVLFLPELRCTQRDSLSGTFCVDLGKARAAQKIVAVHKVDYYFQIFGYSRITIIPIYPPGEDMVLYEHTPREAAPIGNRTDVAVESENSPRSTVVPTYPTFFAVSLREDFVADEPRYGLGQITVEVFS